jgi:hypothetical protein
MPSSSSLRGSRIGAGPPGVPDAGSQELAPRTTVLFRCGQGHKMTLTFADEAGVEIPASTACRRCGMPAGWGSAPPALPKPAAPFKTPMEFLRMRRTQQDGDALVEQALQALRAGRKRPAT